MPTLKYKFEWTPDCQGKWDYDGDVVRVSTRYWPRGGSTTIFARTAEGTIFVSDKDTPSRQHIRPSAHASIYFMNNYDESLVERDFEGETEEEVKQAVEVWVDEQLRFLAGVLASAYEKGV